MDNAAEKKTKNALLWMNLSNEPFVVLYVIIPFILRRDLDASILQLSILTSLRPVLSIFSFYWSANLTQSKNLLRSNLITAWLFARLPFLMVPWMNSSWYILFCCGSYELLNRSGNPALIELLKVNLPNCARNRIYNLGFVLSFIESIILGFVLTALLGNNVLSWKNLFGITALISLSSIFFQAKVPLPFHKFSNKSKSENIGEKILRPWKDAFRLLQANPDFFRFQCGFMLGGIGLMLATPSLSVLFADRLQLTHADITVGRSILMGIGVISSSFFWKKLIFEQKTESLLRKILLGFFCYLFCLYLSQFNFLFFYVSFIIYGIAQAGSHLLWNLSGPLFSGNDDSSQFSRVNILMVGLRGAAAPAIGGVLCNYLGPTPVILIGGATCLAGSIYMMLTKTKQPAKKYT